MTAKEKFYNLVETLGAKRREEIKDEEVYAVYESGDKVHILYVYCPIEGLYDHFIIDAAVASVEAQVLKAIIFATDTDDECRTDEDMRSLLRCFALAHGDITKEDIVDVIVWLWNNTEAFDDMWENHGSFFHELLEDDEETDYASLLRLDDESHSIICQIQGLFNWLDDHNVGYFLSENGNIEFWNGEQMNFVCGADREGEDISLRQAYRTSCITGSTIYMPGIDPRDSGFKKKEE